MMDLEGLLSELGGSGLFLCFAKWPVFSYASTTCCVIWKTFQPPRIETTATLTLCVYGGWGERGVLFPVCKGLLGMLVSGRVLFCCEGVPEPREGLFSVLVFAVVVRSLVL